jgi:hypothetical protein
MSKVKLSFVALVALLGLFLMPAPAQAQANIQYRFYFWVDSNHNYIQDTNGVDQCRQNRTVVVTDLTANPNTSFEVEFTGDIDGNITAQWQWNECKILSTETFYLYANHNYQIEWVEMEYDDLTYFSAGTSTLLTYTQAFYLW